MQLGRWGALGFITQYILIGSHLSRTAFFTESLLASRKIRLAEKYGQYGNKNQKLANYTVLPEYNRAFLQ